jgi:hypothetical protein
MVSCAFATTGIIEIANVRQINLLLIVVVLEAGPPGFCIRRLHPDQHKSILSESHNNFHPNVSTATRPLCTAAS